MAEYGVAAKNGLTLAMEEDVKESPQVELFFEDNRYDAATAVTVFNKLTNLNGVDLVYSWGEAPFNSTASLAEKQHVPLLAMSADPRPGFKKKYVIRTINHTEHIAAYLMHYLRSQSFRRIGILQAEDPFYESLVESLKQDLRPDESIEVVSSVLPSEMDFRSIVSRIKASKLDVLGVYLFPGQISTFFRQAKSLKLGLPCFGYDGFESRKEISDAQGGMEGSIYVNLAIPYEFTEKYQKRFGTDLQIAFAYNAYETLRYIQSELSAAVLRSPNEVISRLVNPAAVNSWPFRVISSEAGGRYFEFPLVVRQVSGDWVMDR